MCLAKGHRATQCHSSKRCCKCDHRHHPSICETENSTPNTEDSPVLQQEILTTTTCTKTRVFL